MRKGLWALMLSLIILGACQESSKPEQKEEEIKKILREYVDAFNRNDTKAMAALWAKDGDLISPWGELATSREDVEKVLVKDHDEYLKNTHLDESIEFIRFITPDVVLVDVDRIYSGLLGSEGKQKQVFLNHAVYALVKRDGKWRIVAQRSYVVNVPIKSV